eukprot:2702100-Ditylum_brightwellii.AAC.1
MVTEGADRIMGLDVTIAPTPKLQTSAADQLTESVVNLHQQEIRKWKGLAQPALTGTLVSPQAHHTDHNNNCDTPNYPAPVQPPPPVLPALAAVHIVKELLAQDIRLFLAPVDRWMAQGPAIKHLLYGNNHIIFNTAHYDFGQGVGSTIGHYMCNFTMASSHFCRILPCANKSWHQQSGTV